MDTRNCRLRRHRSCESFSFKESPVRVASQEHVERSRVDVVDKRVRYYDLMACDGAGGFVECVSPVGAMHLAIEERFLIVRIGPGRLTLENAAILELLSSSTEWCFERTCEKHRAYRRLPHVLAFD